MFRTYQDRVRTPKIEKKHHEVLPSAYNCDLCEKGGWLTPNDVEIHKKNAHGWLIHEYKKHEDRFCTVCMTLLDSFEELVKHIKSKHLLSSPNAERVERVIYICDECTNVFFNKDVLATHMITVHLTKKSNRMLSSFTCPKCFKVFRLHTLWFHLQRHDIPSVSLCDICLCNCTDLNVLKEHLKLHKRYFNCEPCGYTSNHSTQFDLHIQKHKQRFLPDQDVSQNVLNSVFKKRKSTIIRYNMHNAIKGLCLPKFVHICTLCREICVTHGEKKRHVLRDHMLKEVERKKHLCVCGEEFDYKVVLKQHLMKMRGSHYAVDEGVTDTPSSADPLAKQNCLQDVEAEMEVKPESDVIKTIKINENELVEIEIDYSDEINSDEISRC